MTPSPMKPSVANPVAAVGVLLSSWWIIASLRPGRRCGRCDPSLPGGGSSKVHDHAFDLGVVLQRVHTLLAAQPAALLAAERDLGAGAGVPVDLHLPGRQLPCHPVGGGDVAREDARR